MDLHSEHDEQDWDSSERKHKLKRTLRRSGLDESGGVSGGPGALGGLAARLGQPPLYALGRQLLQAGNASGLQQLNAQTCSL